MSRYLTAITLVLSALVFGAFAAPSAATAQEGASLSLEHRMLLRCAATVAMVANGQDAGDAAMADYPDMRERGREFFIRASVRVMDEAGLARDVVEAELRTEARDIAAQGTLHQMMPVCLPLVPPLQ